MLFVFIILGIIALDQLTKFMVINKIALGQEIIIIKDFFYFTYLENRGAAWSILQDQRIFFIIVTLILITCLAYMLSKNKVFLFRFSLSFIMGGAIGNLIDRVLKGSVTDFIGVFLGSYRYPIFNLADSFIVIGVIILAYYIIFLDKQSS